MSSKCERCNWSWWKHRTEKNFCPHSPRNPDGSKPRFKPRFERRKK